MVGVGKLEEGGACEPLKVDEGGGNFQKVHNTNELIIGEGKEVREGGREGG